MVTASGLGIPFLVRNAFNMLNTTNFHERAKLFAREIFITKPILIGLQEISLVRVQPKGDFFAGNPDGAEEKHIDFLEVLLDALHEQENTIILVTHEADIAKHAERKIRLLDGQIASDEIPK